MAPRAAPRATPAQLWADSDEKPFKDFDPEDDVPGKSSDEEQEDDLAGTEHYESVGESKLRQKASASLGPKYKGTRISRAALDESSDDEEEEALEDDEESEDSEEFDDPENANIEEDDDGEDDDIDSDEAFAEGDEQKFGKFTFRGSSKPKTTSRPAAESQESESDDAEDMDGADIGLDDSSEGSDDEFAVNGASLEIGSSEDEEEDDESEDDEEDESAEDDSQAEDKYNAMASIAKQADTEAARGAAIRTQRRHFDSLLNIRIRLQKALVAVNSLPTAQEDQQAGVEPYQAAEDAALKLWRTIDGFRESLVSSSSAKTGDKRKRDVTSDTPSGAIWDMMNETERIASTRRKQKLQSWSEKTKGLSDVTKSRKVISAQSSSIVSVLDDQLLNGERLVKRTRTPRSCAPVQVAKKIEQDPDIYDDADFYQLLLKELVDQRKGDSGAPGSAVPTVRWAAIKEAKTRKQVDRKASKGRKMRYNVHEKIQNFMAPDDRRTWEPEAIDRFFGTLFGKRIDLGEGKQEDVEMGGASLDTQGLKLFG